MALKRCEAFARNFCQCSGFCACLTALTCALGASIYIAIAGDGAGNGPKPIATAYKCKSDLYLGRAKKLNQKGRTAFMGKICEYMAVVGRLLKRHCTVYLFEFVVPRDLQLLTGLAVDDTTFHKCPYGIPRVWPNTQAKRLLSL